MDIVDALEAVYWSQRENLLRAEGTRRLKFV